MSTPATSLIRSVNPATGEVVAVYPEHTADEVDAIIERARQRFASWRRTTFAERAQRLHRVAEILAERSDGWAELMAVEMGKPLREGRAELAKSAWVCRYYADGAEAMLADRDVPTEARRSFVHHEPLGVVLAVMPWNFPFWQVFRFAAPALMAGNVMLLKHAPGTPGCARAIAELFEAAGFPSGAVLNLFVDPVRIESVIADSRVAGVTLTGSSRAGAAVAAIAGKHLKPCVLELGGSDPFVVLADADLAAAAKAGAFSRLLNSGQSCIAAKRFIVVESVADAFLEHLRSEIAGYAVGNPMHPDTRVGPMARADLRATLHLQVTASVAMGAVCECGGELPDGPGYLYPVTLLTHMTPDMPAWREETFGPAFTVMTVPDTKTAMAVANDTIYGLGASVWTANEALAERLAEHVDAGCVFINGMVASDPRLPFGGVRQSGFGRELSWHGLREFCNAKTVWVA